jgi:hypothetical protein
MLFFKSHAASPAHLLCGKGRRAQFPKRWVLGHPKPTKPKRLNAKLLQTKKKKLNFQIIAKPAAFFCTLLALDFYSFLSR